MGRFTTMRIEPYHDRHRDAIIDLSLRAWAPVFESLERVIKPDVWQTMYPDWRASQRDAVAEVCADADISVWIAIADHAVLGFAAVKLHAAASMGEIYMLAVDPSAQGRGVGSALTEFALERIKDAGMSLAMVETGGDPGHAPARRTYEKAGFRLLPIARYFKKL